MEKYLLACPLVASKFGIPYRGGFLAIDAQSGEQIWRFEVDPAVDTQAYTIGGQNRGCGNVWSSPAVDSKRHLVVFGTSDREEQPQAPYRGSGVALDTEAGQVRWVFRPRETDPNKCDFDFGASPNLIELDDQPAVGIGGKDGTYYLLDGTNGQKIWSTRVVFGGNIGGFGGAPFDGRRIFSATAFGDGNVQSQSGLCDAGFHDQGHPNVIDTFVQDPSMHSLAAKEWAGAARAAEQSEFWTDDISRSRCILRFYWTVRNRPSRRQSVSLCQP
jgi:outer membrane protein assembly factor BamB